MHSSVQRARSARLRADSLSLQEVSTQLASLEHEHRAALEKAAALAAGVQQLQRQRNFLASSVAEWRAAYSREFFATCPEELLCYIFERLSNELDDAGRWSELSMGRYNYHRACILFNLAAVCARWRRVALACSALWTYVGLPVPEVRNFESMLVAQRTRVDLLLLRSGSAGLEVLLPWDDVDFGGSDDRDSECLRADTRQATMMRNIFTAISGHVGRWGKASLWMPRSFDRTLLHVLRGATPALTEVVISHSYKDNWNRNPLGGFFNIAPRLKQLRLCNSGMLCSLAASFPCLSYLDLGTQLPSRQIYNFLTRCVSTLEFLEITQCLRDNDGSIPSLTFPRLQTLRLDGVPYFIPRHSPPLLVAPGLRELTLNRPAIRTSMVPFLSNASSTITSLTLNGKISASQLQVLAALADLTHFAMAESEYYTSYTIDDDFFVVLAGHDTDSIVWPKLRSISLHEGGTISYDAGDEDARNDGNGILRLLAQRNTMERPQGDDKPCRLEQVILQYDGVPTWLVAVVKRLLSA